MFVAEVANAGVLVVVIVVRRSLLRGKWAAA
jgi:hypothetical protein